MTAGTRILIASALPPLTVASPASCRLRQDNPLSRLGRIACVLATLALPAFGIAVADMVHRDTGPKAPQAAAPDNPSDGAAAPSVTVPPARARRAVKTAALPTSLPEARS